MGLSRVLLLLDPIHLQPQSLSLSAKCRPSELSLLKTTLSSPPPTVPLLQSLTPTSVSVSTALFFFRVRYLPLSLTLYPHRWRFADFNLIDSLAHFARERIPERVVRDPTIRSSLLLAPDP